MTEREPRQPTTKQRLLASKLAALVRTATGLELEPTPSPGNSDEQATGVAVDDGGRRRGFVLAGGEAPIRRLGPALIWADRADIHDLDVLAEGDVANDLARRAAPFTRPITVWRIDGVEMTPADPAPVPAVPELSAEEWALGSLISEAGARLVDDHGRLVAETAGLEVARVRRDPDGTVSLEVGVGQADRELHQLVHTSMDPDTALRRAIAAVVEHRRPGAPPHPLNRMARERWLRSILLDDPSLVSAVQLDPTPPLRARSTVLGNVPIAAVGRDDDGPVVVVCSTGVDTDLVPEAADYRRREDPDARLVIVVPPPDRYAVTVRLASLLIDTSVVALSPPWAT